MLGDARRRRQPVTTTWDLGIDDVTAIVFAQVSGPEVLRSFGLAAVRLLPSMRSRTTESSRPGCCSRRRRGALPAAAARAVRVAEPLEGEDPEERGVQRAAHAAAPHARVDVHGWQGVNVTADRGVPSRIAVVLPTEFLPGCHPGSCCFTTSHPAASMHTSYS